MRAVWANELQTIGNLVTESLTDDSVEIVVVEEGGDRWDEFLGMSIDPFVPPPAIPPSEPVELIPDLTFAQLLIGLVAETWITEAEGVAWLQGTVPAAVQALIATLPAAQRFAALARATRPSVVVRADPLVNALAAAQSKTTEELDAFFTTYSEV